MRQQEVSGDQRRFTVRAHDMIEITNTLSIDESEIQLDFTHSSGPGGQNVNKVATAVQLRFDVRNSPSLPDEVRKRLIQLAGKRVTRDGILVLDARQFRTQERNRQDAIQRFAALVRKAAQRPKSRRKTSLPAESKQRRRDAKRRRGEIKRLRRRVHPPPE
jgi:ribosome-associated protein